MAQSIIANAVVASGGRMLNGLAGVLVTALLARFLGLEEFGSYVLVMSFAILVQLAADGGLYLTLSRRIAEAKADDEPETVAHITSLRLMLLLVVFSVGTMLTLVIPSLQQLTLVFVIVAIGLIAQSLSQLTMAIWQHHQEVWRATVSDLTGRVAQLAIILLAAASGVTLPKMMLAFTAGAAIQLLVNWRLLPKQMKRIKLKIPWQVARDLINEAWPLAALLLVNAVYFRIDVLILSLYRTTAEVSYYGLAYRVIEAGLFFPAMVGGLLLPRLASALSRGKRAQAAGYLGEGLTLLSLGAIAVLIALVAGSDLAVGIVGGDDFIAAAPLLKVLSLSLAAMFLGNLFGFTLVALKKQKQLLLVYIALMVLNLALNIIFIPEYGGIAAAWTTVITESLAATIAGWLVYRQLKYSFGSLRLKLLRTKVSS